jgi:hypothetical protein
LCLSLRYGKSHTRVGNTYFSQRSSNR